MPQYIVYNLEVNKIILSLLACGFLISCAPSTSNSLSSNPPSTTPNSPQSSSSALPFSDASPNSWQAALREFFTAVRSLQLSEIEKLNVFDVTQGKISNITFNFTPLERQKVNNLLALQGQRSFAGMFCETMKNASFDKIQKISETENLIVVYFTYRTADFAGAKQTYNIHSTFNTLDNAFKGFDQTQMLKEAQWRFVKNADKFFLVYERNDTNPIAKLISPARFITELTLDIGNAIKEAKL